MLHEVFVQPLIELVHTTTGFMWCARTANMLVLRLVRSEEAGAHVGLMHLGWTAMGTDR
jgi:hypothetical protein